MPDYTTETTDPIEMARRAALLSGLKPGTLDPSNTPLPADMVPPSVPMSDGLAPVSLGSSTDSAPAQPGPSHGLRQIASDIAGRFTGKPADLTSSTLDPNDPKYAALAPHGWKKAGLIAADIAGNMFKGGAPVARLSENALYAPQIAYNKDVAAQAQQQGVQTTQSAIADQQSQAKLRAAQADAAVNASTATTVTLPDGRTVTVPQKDAAKLIGTGVTQQSTTERTDATNTSKENIATAGNTAKENLAAGKPMTMDQLAAQATKDGDFATLSKIEEYKKSIAQAGKTEPGNYQVVPDADGNTVGWVNPKSREFVSVAGVAGGAAGAASGGPGGTIASKPSMMSKSRADQAAIVTKAGDGLIDDIQKNRSKLGNLSAIINSAILGTPWSDPETSQLRAEIASFAALNPAMHGFRGTDALKQFEKILGGIPNNPDSMIAAIRGIQKTASAFHRDGPAGGGVGPPPEVVHAWPVGVHTLRNGQVWEKKADGTVSQMKGQ